MQPTEIQIDISNIEERLSLFAGFSTRYSEADRSRIDELLDRWNELKFEEKFREQNTE